MIYFLAFISAFLLSVIFTMAIKKIALKFKIVDLPDQKRKKHLRPMALLGGTAIFLAFFSTLYFFKNYLLQSNLNWQHWLGFFIGSLILIIGGFLDDKYNLKPGQQLIFSVLAALVVTIGGVGINKITNPFGDSIIHLNAAGAMMILSSAFTFLWLLGMMYTTKILDGLDGLVTGLTGIGALVIFLFTMTTRYYQPDMGLAALVLLASCLGFLIFNFHQAKIFLGEGGSLFLGFALGVLAIISGGKVAIALLVMGLPILDLGWIIIRRWRAGHNPLKTADRLHLHYQLMDLGWGTKKTVLFFYVFSLLFGLSALFLQSRGKLLAIGLLGMAMFVIVGKLKKKDF